MAKTISPDRAGYFCFYCHGLGAFERHQRRVWILIIGIYLGFGIWDLAKLI
jgi:NO-binding membrane sensor protein with MHYT domain